MRKEEALEVARKELASQTQYQFMREQFIECNCKPSGRAVFFCHNTQLAFEDATFLPDIYAINLESATYQFEEVEIWMYQELAGSIPKKVVWKDARRLTSADLAQELLNKGWRIQHLANRVRLQAIGALGGWFLDLDQLWINLQKAMPKREAGFHLAASSQVYWFRGSAKHWLTKYLRRPGEKLFFLHKNHKSLLPSKKNNFVH